MCRAAVLPTSGRNASVAYPGMPPVRSGHIVASSARHRHRKQPASVITPMRMMPNAPVPWTTYGAMPVTRMVPARPITKAPHQLVSLRKPVSGSVPSVVATIPPYVCCGTVPVAGAGWSEERDVPLDFPVAHPGVPGAELVALDLGVVVDVVAVGGLAQRLAEHVVGDELVGGVQQGRRQGPDAAGGDGLGRKNVQVVAVGLAGIEAAVDAVEPGGQLDRHGQVRVGRAVAG